MKEVELLEERILNKVKKMFSLEKYDLKEFASFNYPRFIKIFKFAVEQYKVKELGNMSILKTKSIIGMNLLTIVFTPESSRNIPFMIIDYVEIKNKITVFIEFYTKHLPQIDKIKMLENKLIKKSENYKSIEDYREKSNWYVPLRAVYSPLKTGRKGDRSIFECMIIDYLEEYLSFVGVIQKDNDIVKNEKFEEFINDLIVKGNPSTSILNKALGKEKAEMFFRNIIFYY